MEELDWQILNSLYKTKNITRTATNLMISQPAISKRIRQIEERFSCSIGERTKKGLIFTPEGEVLCKRAEAFLRQMILVQDEVVKAQGGVRGTLRVAASATFTKYIQPSLLAEFLELYPQVEVNVMTGWSSEIVSMLRNKEAHFGFIRGDHPYGRNKDKLFEERIYVAFSEYFSLEDLPRMKRVDYRNDDSVELLIKQWWAHHFSELPQVAMSVRNVDICRAFLEKGLGYGFLSEMIMKQDCSALFRRELYDEEGKALKRNTYVIYDEAEIDLEAGRVFLEFIKSKDLASIANF